MGVRCSREGGINWMVLALLLAPLEEYNVRFVSRRLSW